MSQLRDLCHPTGWGSRAAEGDGEVAAVRERAAHDGGRVGARGPFRSTLPGHLYAQGAPL